MRNIPPIGNLVIKIGSNILADSNKGINQERVNAIAGVVSGLASSMPNISIVSSGAIAAGFKTLGFETRPVEIADKQASAAVGQTRLMWHYEQAFSKHNINVAQILVTKYDFSNRKRYLNASATIKRLHSFGVIPIINENDTVVVNELKYVESFGDNDNLSALVSGLIDADMLLILSDVDGLYTANPSDNPHAQLIYEVDEINDSIMKVAGLSSSGVGTGGMRSKLAAAGIATRAGCAVAIINGRDPNNIKKVLEGERIGTYFRPVLKTAAKKRWLTHATIPQGVITIDDGAKKALLERHSSLLATGVTAVNGTFRTGDVVKVVSANGEDIAVGRVRHSSADLTKIKQKRSAEISEILGRKESAIVIHCDEIGIL